MCLRACYFFKALYCVSMSMADERKFEVNPF